MFSRFTSQAQRILLINFGTAKDIVRTLPLVNILRMRFPYAKITWLANPEIVDFLSNYNVVDRIILAKPQWHKSLCAVKALGKRLRNFHPDLCIDLQNDHVSQFAAKLSGSPRCLTRNADRQRISVVSNDLDRKESRLQEYLQLLDAFDVAGASIDYGLPIIPSESHTVDWIVHELGLYSTPFAIVAVGVQSGTAYWQTHHYVQVAHHLGCVLDLPTVIAWQNEQEKQIAEDVVAESDGAVMLAPAISTTQFAALARCAVLCVGADNNFLHIAAAMGRPTIGVFGNAESLWDAPICGNFQPVLAQIAEQHRDHHGKLVETVPVQIDNYTYDVIEVCNACDEVLRPNAETERPAKRHANTIST